MKSQDNQDNNSAPMSKPNMTKREIIKVNWKKIFVWGFKVISFSRAIFVMSVFFMVLNSLLAIYQPMILGKIISELQVTQNSTIENRTSNGVIENNTQNDRSVEQQKGDTVSENKSDGFYSYLFPKSIAGLSWLFFTVVILSIVCAFFASLITTKADSIILQKLQLALHDKILTLGHNYHRENDLGKNSSIVNQFSSGTQMMLCGFYRSSVVQIVTLISSVLVLISQLSSSNVPAYLNVCLIVLIIIFPIIGWKLSNLVMKGSVDVRNSMMEAQSEFINSATHPLEIQLMNANKQRSVVFNNKLLKYCAAKIKAAFYGTVNDQYSSSATPVIQALIIIILLIFTPLDVSTAGTIIVFVMLIPMTLSPVEQIISFFTGINSMWPTVKTVIDVLEMEPEIKESANAVELSTKTNEVKMTNLTFGYTQHGKKIFTNISHVFPAGKITAITAHFGTGKSTAFNLLMRLFDPQEGSISIGGQDIKSVSLFSLRTKVVRVSQKPLFVKDTVRENFKLSKNDATDKEIEEASKKTGFWDILLKKSQDMGIPNPSLNITMTVNEWSGGEQKIFALTRALLVKPAVILIDEPVAGVDAQNSKLIATIIKNIFKGITVLIVDHNQEFIKDVSDFVVCLEDGKFADVGTPEELLQRPSLFKTLLESFKDGKEV